MRLGVATPSLALVGLLVSSCAGGNAASQLAKAPEFQPKDQTKCGVEKSQARPLIVEWPSADRQELESKVHEGIVVVRYQGCQMDVLERCTVPAQYGYRGTTIAQDKVVMKDDDDLYANLPVGAAKLEGELEKSGQLTVDMDLVGRYEAQKATVRADELQGDCAGATHFVYGVAVGAFDFYAGADANVTGGIGVAGIGAGGHSQAERETLTKNGDPSACEKATPDDKAPPSQCGALIRIEVVPLGEAKSNAPTCPDGTQWDGSQCTGKKVVTQVECPGSTTWNGSQCVGTVSADCAPGTHFVEGRGCVAEAGTAPTATVVDRGFTCYAVFKNGLTTPAYTWCGTAKQCPADRRSDIKAFSDPKANSGQTRVGECRAVNTAWCFEIQWKPETGPQPSWLCHETSDDCERDRTERVQSLHQGTMLQSCTAMASPPMP